MKKNHPTQTSSPRPAALRFSPTAWAKLLYLRDAGDSEIAAFGISAADDLLLVEDVRLVQQTATWITAELDDRSVAEFFNDQVEEGRAPNQFGRLFLHTHPGSSAQPSGTDEATFRRVFGGADWALLFIVARAGQTYARLRFNVGPGGEVELPVDVDYGRPFAASDGNAWQQEYDANVKIPLPEPPRSVERSWAPVRADDDDFFDAWRLDAWEDYVDRDRDPEEYGYVRDFR